MMEKEREIKYISRIQSSKKGYDSYIGPIIRRQLLKEGKINISKTGCPLCGKYKNIFNLPITNISIPIEIDHIIPICIGGTSELNNLRVICKSCNRNLGAKQHLFLNAMIKLTYAQKVQRRTEWFIDKEIIINKYLEYIRWVMN